MSKRLSRTLSKSKMDASFPGSNSKRKIKAMVEVMIHGATNVSVKEKGAARAQCTYKRGRKQTGETPETEVVFGMCTWRTKVQLQVTFTEDTVSQTAESKLITFALRAGVKKLQPLPGAKAMVDLAHFYKDGTRQEKIYALSAGKKPVTLKLGFSTLWMQIDNKRIVRPAHPLPSQQQQDEEDYDLETVTFESVDESASELGGGDISDLELSDELGGAGGAPMDQSLLKTLEEQGEVLADYKEQLEELRAERDHLQAEVKRYEGKIDTYRESLRSKNQQIAELKEDAGAGERLEGDKASLQAQLDAAHALLSKKEGQLREARDAFEEKLKVLQERADATHAELQEETRSNAATLAMLGEQLEQEKTEVARLAGRERALEERSQQERQEAAAKAQKAQEKLLELEHSVTLLTSELEVSEQESARLKETLAELRKGAESDSLLQAEVERLKAESRSVHERLTNEQKLTAALKHEIAANEDLLAAQQKQAQEQEQGLESLHGMQARLSKQNESLRQRLKQLEAKEAQVDQLNDQLAALAAQEVTLRMAESEAAQVAEELESLKRAHAQLQRENEELRKDEGTSQALEEAQRKVRATLEDVSFANEKLLKEQQANQELAQELRSLREQLQEQAEQAVAQLERQSAEEEARLKKELGDAIARYVGLEAELREAVDQRKVVEMRAEQAEAEVRESHSRTRRAEEEGSQAAAQVDAARKEAAEAREQLEATEQKLTEQRASTSALKKELMEAKGELMEASQKAAKVEALRAELAERSAELTQAREQLKNAESRVRASEQGADAQLQELQAQLARAQEEAGRVSALQAQVEELQVQVAQVDELQSKVSRGEHDVAALKEALQEAETGAEQQLQSLREQLKRERQQSSALDEVRGQLEAQRSSKRALEEELQRAQEEAEQLRRQRDELQEQAERGASEVRKTIISSVLLGNKGERALVEKVAGWREDAEALNKVANSYMLLYKDNPRSYQHGVRVLAKLCTFMSGLSRDGGLQVMDPQASGVREPAAEPPSEFIGKLEASCQQIAKSLVKSVFDRLQVFLAPAVLSHMPASEDVEGGYQIEETIVEAGSERGKYMTNTILFILTDLRNHMEQFGLYERVASQIFSTLMANVNAYLFQYVIQTAAVCTGDNGFTIRLRLALLDDWFSQPRNKPFAAAFERLRPLQQAAMLMFVHDDPATFAELFPDLNAMQMLSVLEMLRPSVSADMLRALEGQVERQGGNMQLYFKPVSLEDPEVKANE